MRVSLYEKWVTFQRGVAFPSEDLPFVLMEFQRAASHARGYWRSYDTRVRGYILTHAEERLVAKVRRWTAEAGIVVEEDEDEDEEAETGSENERNSGLVINASYTPVCGATSSSSSSKPLLLAPSCKNPTATSSSPEVQESIVSDTETDSTTPSEEEAHDWKSGARIGEAKKPGPGVRHSTSRVQAPKDRNSFNGNSVPSSQQQQQIGYVRRRRERRQPWPRSVGARQASSATRAIPENRVSYPVTTPKRSNCGLGSAVQSSHGRPLNSESTSSSYSALCTAFVPLCTLDTRSNDDGSREVLNAVRRHPRFVNSRADAEIRPVNASTRLQSSSTSSTESCTSVDMAVTLNDLKRSFPPLVLASLAGELIAPGQYLGDEVIRLVLAVLRLSYPRTHILLLNACESLAAVQMDTVPGYAEELLAIVPDRVDREVGACHYAVLHLCFGSGNKQAFC